MRILRSPPNENIEEFNVITKVLYSSAFPSKLISSEMQYYKIRKILCDNTYIFLRLLPAFKLSHETVHLRIRLFNIIYISIFDISRYIFEMVTKILLNAIIKVLRYLKYQIVITMVL